MVTDPRAGVWRAHYQLPTLDELVTRVGSSLQPGTPVYLVECVSRQGLWSMLVHTLAYAEALTDKGLIPRRGRRASAYATWVEPNPYTLMTATDGNGILLAEPRCELLTSRQGGQSVEGDVACTRYYADGVMCIAQGTDLIEIYSEIFDGISFVEQANRIDLGTIPTTFARAVSANEPVANAYRNAETLLAATASLMTEAIAQDNVRVVAKLIGERERAMLKGWPVSGSCYLLSYAGSEPPIGVALARLDCATLPKAVYVLPFENMERYAELACSPGFVKEHLQLFS